MNSYVKVQLTQDQFDALVSFTYNEGTFALRKSPLLRKLNAKDYQGAADQFLTWDKITDPHSGQKTSLVSEKLARFFLLLIKSQVIRIKYLAPIEICA